jgi:hypothetical protein
MNTVAFGRIYKSLGDEAEFCKVLIEFDRIMVAENPKRTAWFYGRGTTFQTALGFTRLQPSEVEWIG